ncbi:MAG: DUF438 domain-containing protein [Candidatus Aenigmatarchaeota archaeon]
MRDKLYETLKALHEGDISEEEAEKAINEATPEEISRAEQKLVRKGNMDIQDLREVCDIHLKGIEDEVEEMKESLPKGHPIRTMILEHEEILNFVDGLEELSEKMDSRELDEGEVNELRHIAEHLVESEKHHEREEETIFPRLEEKGITGPVEIMEMDHNDFLPMKKELKEKAEYPEENRERILELSKNLVFGMRDHIFKENNILYPTALENLENWEEVKKEANEVGYCCFTPEEIEEDLEDFEWEGKTGSETKVDSGDSVLDIRDLPPHQRHSTIFEEFDGLEPGETLVIVNDHDPKPLFYQLKKERQETFDHENYSVEKNGAREFRAHLPKK